jgi:hypothetical protein
LGRTDGPGPAEFDVARFALAACFVHSDLEPPTIIEIYDRHASHHPLDSELLDVVSLAVMANNGVGMLADVTHLDDPVKQQRAEDRLQWSMEELRRVFTSDGDGQNVLTRTTPAWPRDRTRRQQSGLSSTRS